MLLLLPVSVTGVLKDVELSPPLPLALLELLLSCPVPLPGLSPREAEEVGVMPWHKAKCMSWSAPVSIVMVSFLRAALVESVGIGATSIAGVEMKPPLWC